MALRDRAVLVVERDDGRRGEFHLLGAEETGELNREELLGNRGQAIREAVAVLTDSDANTGQAGFSIDAGQGEATTTLSWDGGHEQDRYNDIEVRWGDGSAGIDRYDATGAHPQTQAQVLLWWARTSRSDSFRTRGRLHWGEWTDGSIDGEEGIFEKPIPVTIMTVRVERDEQQPSSFQGTLEVKRIIDTDGLEENNESNPARRTEF